jgi:hypothetical protein
MNMKKSLSVLLLIASTTALADYPAHCLLPDQLRSLALSHQIHNVTALKHKEDILFHVWYSVVGLDNYTVVVDTLANPKNSWTTQYGAENAYGLMCGYRSTSTSADKEKLVFVQQYYQMPFAM